MISTWVLDIHIKHFQPLEVVSRYRDQKLQEGEFNLRPNICKSWCLNKHFIPNESDLIFLRIKNDYSRV